MWTLLPFGLCGAMGLPNLTKVKGIDGTALSLSAGLEAFAGTASIAVFVSLAFIMRPLRSSIGLGLPNLTKAKGIDSKPCRCRPGWRTMLRRLKKWCSRFGTE